MKDASIESIDDDTVLVRDRDGGRAGILRRHREQSRYFCTGGVFTTGREWWTVNSEAEEYDDFATAAHAALNWVRVFQRHGSRHKAEVVVQAGPVLTTVPLADGAFEYEGKAHRVVARGKVMNSYTVLETTLCG